MKKKYTPYMIDIEYELRTYKHIGKDYGNAQSADLGRIPNLCRFIRKSRNREQTQYKFCNTYSDWEEHIRKVLNKNIINYGDMIHWLTYERNYAKQNLEAIKAVLIPIYISFMGLYNVFGGEGSNPFTVLVVIILCIVVISICVLHGASEKVDFFEDCIKIANEIRRS